MARRIAERLLRDYPTLKHRLDPDVAETAGLAHDLGHPPFGHVTERELDQLVRAHGDKGGFEGNPQTFRVLTRLAVRHRDFLGLNLTRASLRAVIKYPNYRSGLRKELTWRKWGAYTDDSHAFDWAMGLPPQLPRKSLEAQIMDWADDIAYAVHDAFDFYRLGLVPLTKLFTDARTIHEFCQRAHEGLVSRRDTRFTASELEEGLNEVLRLSTYPPDPFDGSVDAQARSQTAAAALISRYVQGVEIASSRDRPSLKIARSFEQEIQALKQFVWVYVIDSTGLAVQQEGARRVVRDLFGALAGAALRRDRRMFPARFRDELDDIDSMFTDRALRTSAHARIVADTIASLTDEQAVTMANRLRGVSLGSVRDELDR